MQVSMDGLRKTAIRAYNDLVSVIKANIEKGEGHIEKEDVEDALDDLRMTLGTLAYSYKDGEGGWEALENVTLLSLNDEN